ncbi:MAG TPA: amidase [Vicinamibacterales bacterium]|jgi:Asp-tRNA(Asn)/Glu-tRNA(Gln) amidotransferase A subunit family amidase|nr:amidase [Vicinamibacterales bacterium]
MADLNETRRRFMTHFASVGLGSTLAPGILWARMQDAGAKTLTMAMVADAMKLSGLEFTEADLKSMVDAANQNLTRYEELRTVQIPNDVSPPFHFSALVPGMEVNRTKLPFRLSPAPDVKRPAHLEEAAFWPVRHLAELIRTRQVTSVELTEMYLARLHRYNGKLNNVVTFLDDVGLAEAKGADAEIAAGKYKGPLHGIPWGAKDIISVKGYKTTWGSPAFKEQSFDYDASVVEMLRDAGAVLIAKVTTGELASGDQWFGGQTKSPWNLSQGSSGSSAGPSSATAAGCIAFGIGSETSGSILSPAARCGLAGLRPTFGRISRYGVMALSWTQDRLGPLCRYAEDCAIVMQAIAKRDGRDMSVSDIPFNWNAQLDVKKLRVGIIQDSFDDLTNADAKRNAAHTLETLRSIGVSRFVPVNVPEMPINLNGLSAIGVESAVFFDEHARSGRMKEARGGGRYNGRLVPAVEYLRLQRARMMMMTKLAEATAHVDVYIVAANSTGGGGGGGRGAAAAGTAAPDGTTTPASPTAEPPRPQSPTQRHFNMANLACYPAVNVPNGFSENGSPTNAVFYARPFAEMELLALAKAYQDAAGFHVKRPAALDM